MRSCMSIYSSIHTGKKVIHLFPDSSFPRTDLLHLWDFHDDTATDRIQIGKSTTKKKKKGMNRNSQTIFTSCIGKRYLVLGS